MVTSSHLSSFFFPSQSNTYTTSFIYPTPFTSNIPSCFTQSILWFLFHPHHLSYSVHPIHVFPFHRSIASVPSHPSHLISVDVFLLNSNPFSINRPPNAKVCGERLPKRGRFSNLRCRMNVSCYHFFLAFCFLYSRIPLLFAALPPK